MFRSFFLLFFVCLIPLHADSKAITLISPDHAQTWNYAAQQQHVWRRSDDGHLLLHVAYDNSPHSDRILTPESEDFNFNFPQIKSQPDGTFTYRPSNGKTIVVGHIQPDFIGYPHVTLSPTTMEEIRMVDGYITVKLLLF